MKILVALAALSLALGAFADEKLGAIFATGDDWQIVADGFTFPDGLSSDLIGNVYFCDLRGKPPTIWKLVVDGSQRKIAEAPRSGTRMGPDGRLYVCGTGVVAAYDLRTGKEEFLASDGVGPNDLAVTPRGFVYFTDTAKKQVTFLDPKTKAMKAADVGITKPNGIAVSPDGSTLLVSDAGGPNVWSFKIGDDGSLSEKKPAMTMKCPEKKPGVSGGDGMTVDVTGRAYVTSTVGVQIFASDGTLLGVLPRPQEKPVINACFGGKELAYLYVACGDKIYRRKTLTKGVAMPPLETGGNASGAKP